MIAASKLLQNIYISTVVNTVDLYIYICKKYIHYFLMSSMTFFYLYTFFDVIVFNMLKKYILFVSFMCSVHMASLIFLNLVHF